MTPKHIGIIMDGNRRFAKKLMLKPWQGHEIGSQKIQQLIDWCLEYEVSDLTLYAFSLENFDSRPRNEFDYLIKLFKQNIGELKTKELNERNIRINFIGRLNLFEKELYDSMQTLMEETKNNNKLTINIAMAYGGKSEVIDAVKQITKQAIEGKINIEEINEKTFSKHLYLDKEPDLIIRTGGEIRTSNFLPIQSVYSEWIFLDKKFPEFDKEDFTKCLEEYQLRERRFGN